jgi:type I restriction enzyme S subunit
MASTSPIQVTNFRELERWDVKYFTGRIVSKYPLVPLSEIVYEHNEKIRPSEYPDQSFKILGVNNTAGIFHAYDKLGKKIKQPYKEVSGGDFAYNPYRINVGSIGLVQDEHDDGYISPAYVVFGVDKAKFIPEILLFVLKSDFFNKTLRAATAGSVRMNLTYPLLQTLIVPAPPLSVQQKIYAFWENTNKEISSAIDLSKRIKEETIVQFIQDLGLKLPKSRPSTKYFATRWNEFDRWSVGYNQATKSLLNLNRGKFKVSDLGSILTLLQYGTSQKANNRNDGTPVIRMNNIVEGILDLSSLKHIRLSPKERKGLLLEEGDILFNRTNSKELVGKCAVFREKGDYIFASYLIRIRINIDLALPEFISFLINSPIGRQQINALSRQIIGQANINNKEIQGLQIPLPNLRIQREIMNRVNKGIANFYREREKANELLFDAKKRLKKMILGFHPVEET